MKLAAFGDLDGSAKNIFDACSERLAGVTAIDPHIDNMDQIAFIESKAFQGSCAIRDVGGRDVDHMRQTVCVHADMPLDTGHKLAAVKALLFGCICILHALRVNDEEAGLRAPTKALSDLANRIFLKPLPRGCLQLRVSGSILQNKRGNFPMRENLRATSATGSRFSAQTEPRRIPHISQAFLASFSSLPFPKQVGLSSQKSLG